MKGPLGAVLILSLASLGACSSSSNPLPGDGGIGDGAAGTTGGATGGSSGTSGSATGGTYGGTGGTYGGTGGSSGTSGSATGGTSGGTAGIGGTAGGTGGTSGGTGGTVGGTGGAGGAPSPCAEAAFPVSCPALGDVPAICWSPGTDCSTVTRCGDQFRSCTTPGAHYDCMLNTCVFGSTDGGVNQCGPAYPVSCPATADVPALCWSAGTICSTIGRCGNDFKSCLAPGYHFDCATQTCVPGSGGTDAGAPAPDAATPAPDAATPDAGAPDAATDAAGDATPG